jgi:two-component system sporulation sensor kinase B
MANQLLIHLIIILFPIFVQQFFFSRKDYTGFLYYRIISGLMFGLAALFCIRFPVHLIGGFQLDLRNIPIMIAILYSNGRYLPGIIALVMAAVYRTYIGGDAVAAAWAAFLLCNVPLFLFVRRFPRYLAVKRIVMTMLICVAFLVITYFVLISYLQLGFNDQMQNMGYILHYLLIAVVTIIGTGISCLLKEHMIETSILKLELERSEKMKLVSQIAASVAHEVRNPLTVVKGFLQLVKETADDKRKGYLNMALSELERAEFIITDYLNLAKPQPDQLEIIEVEPFLRHTLEFMNSYSLIQNVQIQLYIHERNLVVQGDKTRLTQVILNLIKNGVEAIPDTGNVTVVAFCRDDFVHIDISDTGIGMPKEQIEHVGTAFFTTKETGTGLGLMVTNRILEAMNGKLLIESELGKGTKVTIRLPAYPSEQGES